MLLLISACNVRVLSYNFPPTHPQKKKKISIEESCISTASKKHVVLLCMAEVLCNLSRAGIMTYTGSGEAGGDWNDDAFCTTSTDRIGCRSSRQGKNDAQQNQLGSKHDAETGTTLCGAQTTCNEKLLCGHFSPLQTGFK